MNSSVMKRFGQIIGARDGWTCHYCAVPLVPRGRESEFCELSPRVESWDWCACGEHDDGHHSWGHLPMPCVRHEGWNLPDEMEWPQVDHVVPRCKGGADPIDNLVLACGSCNARKGSRDYAEFLQILAVAS